MAKFSEAKEAALYFSPKTRDSRFHCRLKEGDPRGVWKEWKDDKTEEMKRAYELKAEYETIAGIIESVDFFDAEFEGKKWTNMNIRLKGDGEDDPPVVISVGATTSYAKTFMEKLPNIDATKEVTFDPYGFTPPGSEYFRAGFTLIQKYAEGKDQKIESYYSKQEKKTDKKTGREYETTVHMNGFPEPEKPYEEMSKAKQDIYKILKQDFLMEETKKHPLYKASARAEDVKVVYPTEEINESDIPF